MWDLPGPGLKPVSPALAGGFLTTVPPGRSRLFLILYVLEEKGWRGTPGQLIRGKRNESGNLHRVASDL